VQPLSMSQLSMELLVAKYDVTNICSSLFKSSAALASPCCCWVLHIFYIWPNWSHFLTSCIWPLPINVFFWMIGFLTMGARWKDLSIVVAHKTFQLVIVALFFFSCFSTSLLFYVLAIYIYIYIYIYICPHFKTLCLKGFSFLFLMNGD
jgi:hypothetical protein